MKDDLLLTIRRPKIWNRLRTKAANMQTSRAAYLKIQWLPPGSLKTPVKLTGNLSVVWD